MNNESAYEQIIAISDNLGLDFTGRELAALAEEKNFSAESIEAIQDVFDFLDKKKQENVINTLLRLSRLPRNEPKTFKNFDFSNLHGRHVSELKNLPTLSALQCRKNLAFIGPQGVGKTHLAMAFGHECCLQGYKTYFLKASELNDKLTRARDRGTTAKAINGLVKPSCLIIDEVGRCVFDKENTRLFFDLIDRRYNKEGPNTMIFTSNKLPSEWGEYFNEDDTLLCSLDRIFDDATVFMIKGDSYRGRKLETYGLSAGTVNHTEYKNV